MIDEYVLSFTLSVHFVLQRPVTTDVDDHTCYVYQYIYGKQMIYSLYYTYVLKREGIIRAAFICVFMMLGLCVHADHQGYDSLELGRVVHAATAGFCM